MSSNRRITTVNRFQKERTSTRLRIQVIKCSHLHLQLSGGLPSSSRISACAVKLALRERRRRSRARLRIRQLRVRAGQLGARGARGGLCGCTRGCLLIQAAPACCSNAMLCVYG